QGPGQPPRRAADRAEPDCRSCPRVGPWLPGTPDHGRTPMPPEPLFDPSHFDFAHVVADQAAIRRVNPQRHEMEHLNAILHVDREQQLCIGYKDVRGDEFWVRGHLPGYPLLPGVLMCEAAAQLCSYYIATQRIMEGEFIGFGGMENVRFRSPVRPGDRLVLVS